jgi:hypothetical protein
VSHSPARHRVTHRVTGVGRVVHTACTRQPLDVNASHQRACAHNNTHTHTAGYSAEDADQTREYTKMKSEAPQDTASSANNAARERRHAQRQPQRRLHGTLTVMHWRSKTHTKTGTRHRSANAQNATNTPINGQPKNAAYKNTLAVARTRAGIRSAANTSGAPRAHLPAAAAAAPTTGRGGASPPLPLSSASGANGFACTTSGLSNGLPFPSQAIWYRGRCCGKDAMHRDPISPKQRRTWNRILIQVKVFD